MNIEAIKARLNVTSLDISEQKDLNGVISPDWVSSWDNVNRVRVTMHREVFNKIVADKAFDGLALKGPETVTPTDATKVPYTRYVIITPSSILGSI